ncbi:urease accessory protein UreE [Magnetovibrio sp.]|uniref:urease accessory protein UreE n=1 Tax=Magnetovibrio sp. TaxID=2024836 RepID=UPI002F95F2A9
MRRAIRVITENEWTPQDVKGTVTLSFEDRFRRRVRLHDDAGEAFLLDLAQATRFEDGDGLVLDGGGVLLVRAALEDVLDVAGTDTQHSARLAWHIGNRHTPVEVLASGHLRIQYDHVLSHMLEGLGATLERKKAPFVPEPGAYDGHGSSHADENEGAAHGHTHSHHG